MQQLKSNGMDNESIIHEVFGGQHRTLTRGIERTPGSHLINRLNNTVRRNSGPAGNININPYINQTNRLKTSGFIDKNWQHRIQTEIIKGNANLFVNIAPSAGKTWPVEEAYKFLLEKSTINNRPVILWVAETRLLASQVSAQLKALIYDMIIAGKLPQYITHPYMNAVPGAQPIDEVTRLKKMVTELTGVLMGGAGSVEPTKGKSIAITCTYSFATKAIQEYRPAIVVIDEVQERFKTGTPNEDEISKVRHFFNNVEAADKSQGTSLVVMTGSMNHETAGFITNYLDARITTKFLHVNFSTPGGAGYKGKISTGEQNKAKITVMPTDLNNKDLPKLVTDIVKGRNPHNLIAIFSKGKISKFTQDIIDATPARNMNAVFGTKQQTINKTGTSGPRKTMNHGRTNNEKLADQIAKAKNTSHGTIATSAATAKVINSPNQLRDIYNRMEDPFLKEAINHGFGYIMSGDENLAAEKARTYNASDIQLVEELFKQGKIYAILATTSVGVGVNLKVRAIYMPSIDMWNGVGMMPMSMSSLAQFVHRAGRKADENAIVYCNKIDLDSVNRIMNSGDPSEHMELIPATTSKQHMGILDRFKYATTKSYRDNYIYKLLTGK